MNVMKEGEVGSASEQKKVTKKFGRLEKGL
jgi:hypothetical protein